MKKFFFSFLLILLVDQGSKWWARGAGLVSVNRGVSFGVGEGVGRVFFSLISFMVLVALFRLFQTIWKKYFWMFGFLSGAAISNVVDRWVWGGVQDFLPIPLTHLQNNLADWVIFLSLVAVLLLHSIQIKRVADKV
jgi:lipoprotein signal peptidase